MTDRKKPQRIERAQMSDRARDEDLAKGWHKLKIVDPEHKPSWKRYGGGMSIVEFSTHERNRHLAIYSTEIAEPDHGKTRGSEKLTMVSLDEAPAQALFDMMWAAGFRPTKPTE